MVLDAASDANSCRDVPAERLYDDWLSSFIQTPTGRDRIKAVHFITGGNHRLYVIFSEFPTQVVSKLYLY